VTDKGKSPTEQALQIFFALRAIEEWQLEAQRAEIERHKALMKRRQSGWGAFVSPCAIDYTQDFELCQLEPLSLSEIEGQLTKQYKQYRNVMALAFGIDQMFL